MPPKYYPEAGSKEDSDEFTPAIVLTDQEKAEKPTVRIDASGEDFKAELIPNSETIHFDELPKSWQAHIRKQKAAGAMLADKMIFTKAEILEAISDAGSFTSPEMVDKLFERIDKEKIDFDLLPKVWQNKLESINKFGNITVDYLKKKGATEENIAQIKSGYYKKINEEEKLSGVRQSLKQHEIEELHQEPIERLKSGTGLPREIDGIPSQAQSLNISGLWNSAKSWARRLFGRK